MGIDGFRRTKEREVEGITFDTRPEAMKARRHKIVFRITDDEKGKSLSLADEMRDIMIEIPLEPVADLIKGLKWNEL